MMKKTEMKVFSEDKASHIIVEVKDSELLYYPSVNLYVEIADGGFFGAHDVWVSLIDLMAFVTQLRQCEQTRQGKAILSSLDELEMVIEKSDGWGHFWLQYRLRRTSFTRRHTVAHSLVGAFDLDASLFAQTVSEFADLLPDLVS